MDFINFKFYKTNRRVITIFKVPKEINKPENTYNWAVGVGTIQQISKNVNGEEELEPFYKKIKDDFYVFQCNLKAGDTVVRLKGLNSKNFPDRAKKLADKVNDGDYVQVEGRLNERRFEDNIYREIVVTKITPVTKNDKPEEYAVANLQGKIDYIDFDEDENLLKMILTMPRFNSDEVDEYRIVGVPGDEYVDWLINKTPAPEEGDVIKVGCDIFNELKRDRFGDIEDVVNQLRIAKITHYHSKNATAETTDKPKRGF